MEERPLMPSPLPSFRVWTMTLLSMACSDPTAVTDGVLTVERHRGSLTLRNASLTPVHYFVVERTTATRVRWLACAGPGCPAVPAADSVTVPDSLIFGFTPAAQAAVVYWWHAVPRDPSGLRADSIRSLTTPL